MWIAVGNFTSVAGIRLIGRDDTKTLRTNLYASIQPEERSRYATRRTHATQCGGEKDTQRCAEFHLEMREGDVGNRHQRRGRQQIQHSAPGGTRTPDQEFRRFLLYPLSYERIVLLRFAYYTHAERESQRESGAVFTQFLRAAPKLRTICV